jgi:uncharacterized protein
MHQVIAGATGLIGKRLVEHALKQHHTITVIGRTHQHIQAVFGNRVQAVTWSELTVDTLKAADVVINLTGENVGGKRWSSHRKHEIINSRVGSTKKLVSLLCEMKDSVPRFFNASAVGVYGLQTQLPDQLPPALTEDTPIDYEQAPDFMSLIGRQWEKAAYPAIEQGIPVVFLRFGVVLAVEGGALPELMRPFTFYVGGTLGTGKQAFNWVEMDDVIRAIDFLIEKPEVTGPVNIVAPDAINQSAFARALGNSMRRPSFMKTPAFILKLVFGEMAQNLILEGQNVYPKRLMESGFKFIYSDIESALNYLIKS